MKKLARSNPLSARKLVIHRETVRVLRQLALRELGNAHGALSTGDCEASPPPPQSVWCD